MREFSLDVDPDKLEAPSQALLDTIVERARQLERAKPGDGISNEERGLDGNKYVNLFSLLAAWFHREGYDPTDSFTPFNLRVIQSFGPAWQRFLEENPKLLAECERVSKNSDIIGDALLAYRDLLFGAMRQIVLVTP